MALLQNLNYTKMIKSIKVSLFLGVVSCCILSAFSVDQKFWESKFIEIGPDMRLRYLPDDQGNIIPDFSRVGYYHGSRPIPESIKVVKTLSPLAQDSDAGAMIQDAIDEVSNLPINQKGYRGTILLKSGIYRISGSIHVHTSGIVLLGEGNRKNGTILLATGQKQRSLLIISGSGKPKEVNGTRTSLIDQFVPTGSFYFRVLQAQQFKVGDQIMLYRPGTASWISDLKMNQIEERKGTKQWQAQDYNLNYERSITKIAGDTIFIDNPTIMPIEKKYGGAEIYRYEFAGRIANVGIQNIRFESTYDSDTDENHGWTALEMNNIENAWVSRVTSSFFGYSCVWLKEWAKNVTVTNCECTDAKSIITGGRRYSFNNNGQQNLFSYLKSEDGRHDYVTGARTCGPNVFTYCTAKNTHADIGPHHRWASGTLFDNIITDGDINVQDRGNWGSGHGWSGVTQVLWNCKVRSATVQNPWVSGKNYAIGVQGNKTTGRLKNRPDGEWDGLNKPHLQPESLFFAQLNNRKNPKP